MAEEIKNKEKTIEEEKLIRILSKDIPGRKNVYSGLILIKGISWNFSNAICKKLNLDKKKKIQDLSSEEIKKISEFVKNPDVPDFLINRKKDLESGKNKHLYGGDLDLQREFDIKRLKKIKSYRGIRHSAGLPVRGQRTKSHFRKGGVVGVRKSGKKR